MQSKNNSVGTNPFTIFPPVGYERLCFLKNMITHLAKTEMLFIDTAPVDKNYFKKKVWVLNFICNPFLWTTSKIIL